MVTWMKKANNLQIGKAQPPGVAQKKCKSVAYKKKDVVITQTNENS